MGCDIHSHAEREIDDLHLDVRGSQGIDFSEGWRTGDMTASGVQVSTVWYSDDRRIFGGCIDRAQALQLREFLSACIAKWDAEGETLTTKSSISAESATNTNDNATSPVSN